MISKWAWRWVLVSLLCLQIGGFGCSASDEQENSKPPKTVVDISAKLKKGQKMANIQLTSSLSNQRVLSGETLAVRSTITNTGSTPCQIELVRQPPLRYVFRDSKSDEVVYSVSAVDVPGALSPDGPPRMEMTETIAPGGTYTIGEIVSNFIKAGFRPGHYTITVYLNAGDVSAESEVLDLVVETPKTSQLDNIQCAWADCNITGFVHQSDPERVYVRESDGQMLTGSFDRIDRAAGQRAVSLSASVHLGPRINRRWVVWIENSALFYAPLWGHMGVASKSGVEIPLADLLLLQPGFQTNEEESIFFILGRKNGVIVWLTATIGAAGVSMGPQYTLRGGLNVNKLPDRVLLRYIPKVEAEDDRYDDDDELEQEPVEQVDGELDTEDSGEPELEDKPQILVGSASIQMVLIDQIDKEIVVSRRRLDTQGLPLDDSVDELLRQPGRLLAAEMESYAHTPQSYVHVLIENPEDNTRIDRSDLDYLRIPVAYVDGEVARFHMNRPAAAVADWAIHGRTTGGLLVVAATNDNIMYTRAKDPQWKVLANAAGFTGGLGLTASVPDKALPYWEAFWLTDIGIHSQRDPAYVPK